MERIQKKVVIVKVNDEPAEAMYISRENQISENGLILGCIRATLERRAADSRPVYRVTFDLLN